MQIQDLCDLRGAHIELICQLNNFDFEINAVLNYSFLTRYPSHFEPISSVRQASTLWGEVSILLVDDSEEMISAFKMLLEMEGAHVRIASNAKEGLEIVAREKIDLLISDISMPEMNGYEFIEKVRQLPVGKTLPAIALSGLSREQDIAQCYKAGFSAHFNKPIALDKLTNTIINLVGPSLEYE